MAHQTIWYYTDLPEKFVDILCEDFENNFAGEEQCSKIDGGNVDLTIRNSKNVWVSTNHWSSGFVWNYVQKANRDNFCYDLTCIDGESMQYTTYEKGQFYKWHNDAGLPALPRPERTASSSFSDEHLRYRDFLEENTRKIRKLSFVLQLSNPSDFRGGNLQIMDEYGKSYMAPRQRGTIILFDSRSMHRVLKVKEGVRKSLVGWVVGPRWK